MRLRIRSTVALRHLHAPQDVGSATNKDNIFTLYELWSSYYGLWVIAYFVLNMAREQIVGASPRGTGPYSTRYCIRLIEHYLSKLIFSRLLPDELMTAFHEHNSVILSSKRKF